jgi:murein DD-endopeptidase MepM/ murein hydrolase activator NlpD
MNVAPASKVFHVGYNPGNGNYVCVYVRGYDDRLGGQGLFVAYLHLDSISVTVGEEVGEGTRIGWSGNTGSNTTGPHLHITMSNSEQAFLGIGQKIDPYAFIESERAKPAPKPPAPPAGSSISIDGDFGSQTKRALQTALGVTADGDFGPASTRALQTFLGIAADGSWGPATTRALQGFLGVPADGSFGPQTIRSLQASLSGGTFVKPVVPAPVKPKPEPVKPEPVKPEPVKPTKPKQRESITEPKKIPERKPMPTKSEEKIASLPTADLGVIIMKSSHRKLAYALYAGVSIVVTNVAVGFASLGAPVPGWLTVAVAVIGNLAVPFSALAIANAPKKSA